MKLTRLSLLGGLALFAHAPQLSADTLKPVWAIIPPPKADGSPTLNTLATPPGLTAATIFDTNSWFLPNESIRGLAVNQVTGNVLVSDTAQNIRVLNSSGQYLHTLSKTNLVGGGTLNMIRVGVAEDGVVYSSNLSATTPPTAFKIWRWENDSNPTPDPLPENFTPVVPTLAWPVLPAPTEENPFPTLPSGDPASLLPAANNQRWGDTLDVKGAGANTKLVFGARNNPVLALFTTADGLTFSPHVITFGGSGGNLGVAFGPDVPGYDDPATTGVTENLTLTTVFVKIAGSAMRRVSIRPDTWTAVSTTFYDGLGGNPPTVASNISGIGTDRTGRFLGAASSATATAGGDAYGYELSTSLVPSLIAPDAAGATKYPVAGANTNALASADVWTPAPGQIPGTGGLPARSRIYTMITNNAIVAYDILPAQTPPSLVTDPASVAVISGWKHTFSAAAAGTQPITYQWTRNGDPILGATGSSYTIDPVTVADNNAIFAVQVTNPLTTVTSANATLTVQTRLDTPVMTLGYKIPADTRSYLTSAGDTQRGLAWNPVNDRLLLVNRTTVAGLPSPSVILLNAATGNEVTNEGSVRTLLLQDSDPVNNITGGTFPLSAIDVADDGAIFASNLVDISLTADFKIYRWADDAIETTPKLVYGPSSLFADRAGEHIKVRGSGANTQLLVGARNQPKFAIFREKFVETDFEGIFRQTFEPKNFEIEGLGAGSFAYCDFGAGNTIWAKTETGKLCQISFDLESGVASVLQTFTTANFPSGVGPIAIDPVKQLLGGIHNRENPNNLRLYNYNRIGQTGGFLDQEFFSTDNTNGNFVGAVDLGNNRIYALDTNNGLVVMNINYTPPVAPVLGALVRSAGNFSFTLTGTAGASYLIQRSTDMATWADDGTEVLGAGVTTITVTRPATEDRVFFRARAL